MSEQAPLTIFDYIREINKLPPEIISPAKFKLLVEIAMRLGKPGKTWPKNKELAEHTAIKVDSIRVLLSNLKKQGYIKIRKEDGRRNIYLCHPIVKKELTTVFKNKKMLMVINKNGSDDEDKMLMDINKSEKTLITINKIDKNVNGDYGPYIKEQTKEKSKEQPVCCFPLDVMNLIPKSIDQKNKRLIQAIKDSLEGDGGIEVTKGRIEYTNTKSKGSWIGYFTKLVSDNIVPDSVEVPVVIPENASTQLTRAIKCYNANLKKPINDRCQSAWGTAVVTDVCRANCPKFR